MSRFKKISDNLNNKLSISRRSFIKAAVVVGGSASVYGCVTKNAVDPILMNNSDLENVVITEDLSDAKIYTASCVNNCGTGTRCVSKLHILNDKIVRVTTDDSDNDYEGNLRDKEQYNDSRSLSCAKGRASKYKLYHSGRLKYPLKQTKARGDVSGFVRVSSEAAMKEISRKHRAIYKKYGDGAIGTAHSSVATYGGTFSNPTSARDALTVFVGGARKTYSDYSYHQYNFAYPLTGHPGVGNPYNKSNNIGAQLPHVAGVAKNIVSWGTNVLTTNNSISWGYARSIEKMKERDPNAKVYFIGPEFVDTGVTCATDWVQLRNYTDSALIMSMIYEMIINTVDKNGKIMPKPWLDLEYLDTMVYGFFDSPEYNINEQTGVITITTDPAKKGERKIYSVPSGRSLSAYIMGSDDRLTKIKYNQSKNYTAKQFGVRSRNLSVCSYPSDVSSKYYYKQDMNNPKTPTWASAICGTPVAMIKELAKMYTDPSEHPIVNEWCGGVQKQDNGVVNIFAIASLLCITKTFGMNGEGLFGPWASTLPDQGDVGAVNDYLNSTGAIPSGRPSNYNMKKMIPTMSRKEWFNGVKVAFHDLLKVKGYKGEYIPEWDGITRYVNNDGAAKASIEYKYTSPVNNTAPDIYKEDDIEYYDYIGRGTDTPTYAGMRMLVNNGGGILLNQHSNTNDNAEMYKLLPLATEDPDDPDTLCLVAFDICLSPTARYSDYVLPSTVSLEAGDWMDIGGEKHYRPPASKAPGEAKDGWRFTYEAYKIQSELGDFNDVKVKDAHLKYVGTAKTSKKYQSAEVLSLKIVDSAIADRSSRFFGMTRDQVFANQYRPRKNQAEPVTTDLRKGAFGETLRRNLDTYLTSANISTTPFIKPANINSSANANIVFVEGDWGSGANNIAEWSDGTRPNFTGKFHVYNGAMVWDYERRYSKWHGWLPKESRGQKNEDYEGDPIVYPIPMYLDFRDSFNEAYGVFAGKPENDLSKKGGLTMSTTHDRFRVHSTLAENPLLRELNHRTKGGGYGSGNDWNEYAVLPDSHKKGETASISPMISSAVYNKDMYTASWHEIWVNDKDATERGIVDGDLIVVENPIGAVRVVARVTKRCMRGHINLHQGGWYDPNPIDGIDDGGCANTLMSSKASRIDHGNAQQSAYVTIRKDTLFD